MSLSLANLAFGLLPAVSILFVVWVVCIKFSLYRTASALTVAVLLVTFFYSFNTYGPRVELSSAAIPGAPEATVIERGEELVQSKDRIGQFDQKINSPDKE